jgi:TRAP-type C4-dicarboxylate transport system permease small subunit
MQLEKKLSSGIDRIIDLFGVLTAAIILFIMAAVVLEVIMRYFFGHPTSWVLDVVEWGMVWMTFFAAPYVLREGRHVSMDIVSSRLSTEKQLFLKIITSFIAAIICLTLAVYGSIVVQDHFARGVMEVKMLQVPKAPLLIIIPLGFFMLFIQSLRQAFVLVRKWRTGCHD